MLAFQQYTTHKRIRTGSKPSAARRAVGVEDSDVPNSLAEEESWDGPVRVEVKAGAQVKPIATRFYAAEAQSDKGKSADDERMFALVAMPEGTADGLVVMRLSEFKEIVLPLLTAEGL